MLKCDHYCHKRNLPPEKITVDKDEEEMLKLKTESVVSTLPNMKVTVVHNVPPKQVVNGSSSLSKAPPKLSPSSNLPPKPSPSESLSKTEQSQLRRASDNEPEPPPLDSNLPATWDLVMEDFKARACEVIADMQERHTTGTQKYKKPLTAGDGRNSLVDAYQEALDLVVYLKNEILKAASKDKLLDHMKHENEYLTQRVKVLQDML